VDAICTISDGKYASKAFAMLQSASNCMPNNSYFFMDIEGCKPRLEKSEIQVLSFEDVGFSTIEVDELSSRYNVIEFATALKPGLMKALLKRGFRTVTYLDPDILVTDSLVEAQEIACSYEAVIVPHRLTPDSSVLSDFELGLNRVGIFNLGFITTSQLSFSLLDWWQSKTLKSASMNWFKGQFTDQKWVDFFPVYFNTMILRDPGYNLAPWNIDERKLRIAANGVELVLEKPLRFIHFSQGSDNFKNSNFLNQWVRANSSELSILKSLSEKYLKEVSLISSNLKFTVAEEDRLQLSSPKRRINLRDGIIEGAKMDFNNLVNKFLKHPLL